MKTKTINTVSPLTPSKRLLCLLFPLTLLAASTASAQILYDFNTPNQLADNFYPGTQFGSFGTQVSSGGLNDSGRVDNTITGARGFLITNQTFSALTPEVTLSAYFQFGGTSGSFSGETLWLGVGRDSDSEKTFDPVAGNSGPLGSPTGQSLQVGIGPRTSENVVRVQYAWITDGVLTNSSLTPTATLTVGNWYYLEVNYTLSAEEDGYSFTVGLYDSTSTGIVSETSLLSHSASIVNPNLADGELHAFFGGRNGTFAGAVAVDNFAVSAIPEPSTYAFIGGILALGVAFWYRRRAC